MEIYGGKLVAKGSNTCIFNPSIPCSKGNDKDINKVSKLLIDKSKQRELLINKKISKLVDNNLWSVLFTEKCNSPKYNEFFKHDKSIKKCLNELDIEVDEFDNMNSILLLSKYGGLSMSKHF